MENETREKLAENLRVLRARKNIKVLELSEAIGTTPASVSTWERGTGGMTLDNAVALADYYGVSLDELVGRS